MDRSLHRDLLGALRRSNVPELAPLIDLAATPRRSVGTLYFLGALMAAVVLFLPIVLITLVIVMPRQTLGALLFVGLGPAIAIFGAAMALPIAIFASMINRAFLREYSKFPEIALCSSKAPTLYLRQFEFENPDLAAESQLQRRGLRWWAVYGIFNPFIALSQMDRSFESFIQRALRKLGPVICLGDPLSRQVPGSASRLHIQGPLWKEAVRALVRDSNLIVLYYDRGEAVDWEAATLLAETDNPVLVWMESLVVPYERLRTQGDYLENFPAWLQPRLREAGLTPAEMGEEGERGYLFLFDSRRKLFWARPLRYEEDMGRAVKKVLKEAQVAPVMRATRSAWGDVPYRLARLSYRLAPTVALASAAVFAVFWFSGHPAYGPMPRPINASLLASVEERDNVYLYLTPHYEDEFDARGDELLESVPSLKPSRAARYIEAAISDYKSAVKLSKGPLRYEAKIAKAYVDLFLVSNQTLADTRALDTAFTHYSRVGDTAGMSAVLARRVRAYANNGRLDLAFNDLTKIEKLSPNTSSVLKVTAEFYNKRFEVSRDPRDANLALASIDQAIATAEKDGEALALRGWILVNRAAHLGSQSVQWLPEVNSKLLPPEAAQCVLGAATGANLEAAKSACEALLRASANDPAFRSWTGMVALRSARMDEAQAAFAAASEAVPEDAGYVFLEALTLPGAFFARAGSPHLSGQALYLERSSRLDPSAKRRLAALGFAPKQD